MAGLILDSSGTIKMKVLDDATLALQRLNGMVENYAMNAKKGVPSASIIQTIKRNLTTLAANLKTHFGMISDLVTNVYINSSRGASDQGKVRVLREGLAQIKQAIEIGTAQTIQKHQVDRHAEEKKAAATKSKAAGDAKTKAASDTKT